MDATVIAVAAASGHNFSKPVKESITLIKGIGVEGDAHAGKTVKHRSRVAKDPSAPNLRQVHLIHSELFDELSGLGFAINPGDMGENVTTCDVDLLRLPTGAHLSIGGEVIVEITGLRNPCKQLNKFQDGLLNACLDKDPDGKLIRKAGVMGIVIQGGEIKVGDGIKIALPEGTHSPLNCV